MGYHCLRQVDSPSAFHFPCISFCDFLISSVCPFSLAFQSDPWHRYSVTNCLELHTSYYHSPARPEYNFVTCEDRKHLAADPANWLLGRCLTARATPQPPADAPIKFKVKTARRPGPWQRLLAIAVRVMAAMSSGCPLYVCPPRRARQGMGEWWERTDRGGGGGAVSVGSEEAC